MAPTSPSRPPLPLSLLGPLLPRAERAEVLGDLEEEHGERRRDDGPLRAGLWLWAQALRSLPTLLARIVWRGRTGFEPPSSRFRPGGSFLEGWIIDLRYAVRQLRSRPLVALLAILTLSVGAGGATAITSIVSSWLLAPLPFAGEEALVEFWDPYDWSEAEHTMLRGRTSGFLAVAAHRDESMTLRSGDAPARLLDGVAASSELFAVLGRGPLLGRAFEAGDDRQGAEPVAVLSEGLWRRLGADREILGKSLALDGVETTVVGVMPGDFWFPRPGVDLWVATPLDPENFSGNYALVGRLEPGRDPATNMVEPLEQIASFLRERIPYPPEWDKTIDPALIPLRRALLGEARPTLLATEAALLAILLIAVANVAALLLGHLGGRREELAVRSALGAPKTRLARQLLAEALLLGLVAGVAATAVAGATFSILRRTLPLGPLGETLHLDWTVVAGAIALGIGSAVLTSLVPIVDLLRSDLGAGLGDSGLRSGRGAVGSRGARVEGVLVVGEIALAVLLTAGTALLVRSVENLGAIDPGLESDEVAVVEIAMPQDLSTGDRRTLLRTLRHRFAALPAVESAGAVQHLPLQRGSWSTDIEIEGEPLPERTTTYFRMVTPGYLETVGLRLLRGRMLTEADAAGEEVRVVINESLAERYFGRRDPIGRRISHGMGGDWARIVGVVENESVAALTDEPSPARYMLYEHVPFCPDIHGFVLKLRRGHDPAAAAAEARSIVEREAPGVAVARTTSLEAMRRASMGATPKVLRLVGLLTVLALGLGAIGVYGVLVHFVGRRSREWSLRLALGQRPLEILTHVLRRSVLLVGGGLILGVVASAALGRVLGSLLYGVRPVDPLALGAACATLLLTGVLAAVRPAWRAATSDPATLLRR